VGQASSPVICPAALWAAGPSAGTAEGTLAAETAAPLPNYWQIRQQDAGGTLAGVAKRARVK